MAASKTVTFISRIENQLLWVDKPPLKRDGMGNKLDIPGTPVQFENHRFSTDDAKLQKHIRDSGLFNNVVWEDGNAPDEPKPTVKSQLAAIVKAKNKADIEKVVQEENRTHKRAAVIDAAEVALDELAEKNGAKQEKAPSTSTA